MLTAIYNIRELWIKTFLKVFNKHCLQVSNSKKTKTHFNPKHIVHNLEAQTISSVSLRLNSTEILLRSIERHFNTYNRIIKYLALSIF